MGLITFQGAEATLGEALGITAARRGHFWGMRGSNALSACTLLLVVGTPTPNLDLAVTWARALYRHDLRPISTETVEDEEDGRDRFADPDCAGWWTTARTPN